MSAKMTRRDRLRQANAALFLGFSIGCAKRGRMIEADEFHTKAVNLCPTVERDTGALESHGSLLGSITEYGRAIASAVNE